MEKTYQYLSLTIEGRIARIQFRNPPLNIFTLSLLEELLQAVQRVRRNPMTSVLIFSSANAKHFSAGVAIQDHYPRTAPKLFKTFHAVFRLLWSWDKLNVAEIDGYCLGGGSELALACDLAIASSGTTFGFPEITVGSFPPIAVLFLPPAIGRHRANEWLLSGSRFTATEALDLGLINRAVPSDQIPSTTKGLLEPILHQSPIVLRKTLQALRAHTKSLIPHIKASERLYLKGLLNTQDAIEGLDAFLQKRPPRWKGR